MTNTRPYVGLSRVNHGISYTQFRSPTVPTKETHPQFFGCIGPCKTNRGVLAMVQFGYNNPHCQTVGQAERLGKKYAEVLKKRSTSKLWTGEN